MRECLYHPGPGLLFATRIRPSSDYSQCRRHPIFGRRLSRQFPEMWRHSTAPAIPPRRSRRGPAALACHSFECARPHHPSFFTNHAIKIPALLFTDLPPVRPAIYSSLAISSGREVPSLHRDPRLHPPACLFSHRLSDPLPPPRFATARARPGKNLRQPPEDKSPLRIPHPLFSPVSITDFRRPANRSRISQLTEPALESLRSGSPQSPAASTVASFSPIDYGPEAAISSTPPPVRARPQLLKHQGRPHLYAAPGCPIPHRARQFHTSLRHWGAPSRLETLALTATAFSCSLYKREMTSPIFTTLALTNPPRLPLKTPNLHRRLANGFQSVLQQNSAKPTNLSQPLGSRL